MRTSVERLDGNRVVMEVEVEAARVDKALQQAHRNLAKRVNIPGFRKGKAPRRIIENFIGKEPFYQEAADIVIPGAYVDAVQENSLEPIDQPDVELVKIEEGQPLIFKATVDVKPEVDLGQYVGLEVAVSEPEISEEQVNAQLEAMQERYAKLDMAEDGQVRSGDLVTIDYRGKVDGEEFQGGQGENFALEIGSKRFIPGFEDQMVGARINEQSSIQVTFPEDYFVEDLAGKEAVFEVMVREIKRKELAVLDDDFAKDVSSFETLEELKEDLRNKLKKAATERAEAEFRNKVVQQAVSNARVEVPEVLVERQVDAFVQDLERRLAMQRIGLQDYLSASEKTPDALRADFRPQAARTVKTDLVLEAVARVEQVEATPAEVDAELEKMATAEMDLTTLKQRLVEQGALDSFAHDLKLRKTIDLLAERAYRVKEEVGEETPESRDKGEEQNRVEVEPAPTGEGS